MRNCCMAFAMLGVASCAPGIAAARSNAIVSDEAYTHVQTLVAIDRGRRLNLYCIGSGSPTVVFDAGLGDTTAKWGLIQPVIAEHTKACSSDRAGLGFSDAAERPGTSASSADDLHRLLRAAHIAPPYILVGHSLGGMNVRLYADRHLSDVAGMVLVDPSHEDQSRIWDATKPTGRIEWEASLVVRRSCITTARTGFVAGSALFETCTFGHDDYASDQINAVLLQLHESVPFQQAVQWEMESVFDASADEVRGGRRSYGDMPLIVLTHSPMPKASDETQEQRDVKTRIWEELHDQIAALSTRGVNRTVVDSGHYIQLDQPQIVIDAILEVLDMARAPAVSIKKGRSLQGGRHADLLTHRAIDPPVG